MFVLDIKRGKDLSEWRWSEEGREKKSTEVGKH